MASSKIGYTDETWNPTTGCTKISDGCTICYVVKMAMRLQAMGQRKYKDGFKLTIHPDTLGYPYTLKKPKYIFVNSMSDLFHKDVPIEFIKKVFSVMNDTPRHTYQVLTKRSERLAEISHELNWTDNIWMGVSVENEKVVNRIDDLRKCGAKVKYLSCEPLLGPLANMNLTGIGWVIVGGESGAGARPMEKDWVDDIQQQCTENNVAFYFKQWGGFNKKKAGRSLNGKTFDEMPTTA